MFKILREIAERLLKTRIFILLLIIVLLFLVLVQHLFNMQIIHGNDYQETYTESIQKTITVDGVRGNIYDKNGVLLAYNKLSYKVTLQDSGTYSTTKEKNAALNQEINRIIELIQAGKDSIENNFSMTYHKSTGKVTYDVSGTALQRFRADVFGHSKISDLSYNKKLGGNEATASASDVYAFLLKQYGLDTKEIQNSYTPYRIYQILMVRYALAANSYQKYVSTTIAKDVSDETVAAIKENSDSLEGVSIENDTKRVYTYPEYLSGIIGYVGQISTDEYSDYSKDDSTYSLSDYVGKTGIEKVMESQLRGKKGRQEVYVNNVGKIQKVISSTSEQTGNNVYLSIDAKLQKAVYQLLEQEIAGILSSSLEDTKSTSSKKNIFASSYEVYTALLTNNVIDLDQLPSAKSGTVSAKLYSSYRSRRKTVLKSTRAALNAGTRYKDLSDTMQDYISYIVKYLQGNGVFDSNMVDSSNRTYKAWKKGTISAKEYLEYAIEQNWIDISSLNIR
ncbi:MAG: peptidoglycan glycosyltransferase, partial [Eubacterium sp.]